MQDLRQQRQDKFVSGRYDYLPGQWRRQAQRLLDSRSETAHCGRIDFDGLGVVHPSSQHELSNAASRTGLLTLLLAGIAHLSRSTSFAHRIP